MTLTPFTNAQESPAPTTPEQNEPLASIIQTLRAMLPELRVGVASQ